MTYSQNRRIRKAYWTAFVVALSYLWLVFLCWFLGKTWYQRRIGALHVRNAERIKKVILALGGLFIKIGQLLSVMSNFLPEAFQRPLEALQDRLPARPYSDVERRLIEGLGRQPEAIFSRFDRAPSATASIGQAHRAALLDGTEVVVKVQHYDIEEIAQIDLGVVQKLTRIYSWFMDIKGLDYLYAQIRQMIEEELDFANEARAMDIIRRNLADEPEVSIPEVFANYSTRRILTTRYCVGAKISDTDQIDAWGIDRRALAARLLRIWCRMVFKDGYYHADPHPGNLLVDEKGQIVLLDFGATASISPSFRAGMIKLIEATVKNDTEATLEACRSLGFLADGMEAEKMARKMIAAIRNFFQTEIQFEGLDFRDIQINPFNNSLSDLINEIGFRGISGTVQMPKDYVLLSRTITLLLGLSNTLDSGYNPLDTVRPFAQQYLMKDKGGVVGYVKDLLQRTLTNALALPDELQKTLLKVRSGELEIRTPDIDANVKLLVRVLRRLGFAILAIGMAFFSLRLREMGWIEESQWGFWAAAALTLASIWRIKRT
jgi:predicted unusual protein kinase regulating ubiquinone biosynthesis (AarF/ABC1/UbiB family)